MSTDFDTLHACCTLARVDHVDTHLMRTDAARLRTPEHWAREIMEGPPAATRARLAAGWTMLGIRLHHRRPVIAGWPITHSDGEYVRLQGDSMLGLKGQLVTRVVDDGVEFGAFVQLGNPAARALWKRVLPAHLEIVELLLGEAADRAG